MSKYTDKERIIDALVDINSKCIMPTDWHEGLSRAIDYIKHMSTTESRPKGEWLHAEIIDDDEDFGVNSDATQCSICGDYQDSYHWAKTYFHYCPNCGADMRGKEE